MQLLDNLLRTNQYFLLGRWLSYVPPWAISPAELSPLNYDARSILTTWGDRKASEAGLHEYANRDYAGLTSDYYAPRWQLYFDSLLALPRHPNRLAERAVPQTHRLVRLRRQLEPQTKHLLCNSHRKPLCCRHGHRQRPQPRPHLNLVQAHNLVILNAVKDPCSCCCSCCCSCSCLLLLPLPLLLLLLLPLAFAVAVAVARS